MAITFQTFLGLDTQAAETKGRPGKKNLLKKNSKLKWLLIEKLTEIYVEHFQAMVIQKATNSSNLKKKLFYMRALLDTTWVVA